MQYGSFVLFYQNCRESTLMVVIKVTETCRQYIIYVKHTLQTCFC
jgi:hypothetical protein